MSVKELLNGGQVKQLVCKIMFMEIKLSNLIIYMMYSDWTDRK